MGCGENNLLIEFVVECGHSCGIMVPYQGWPLESDFCLALCRWLGGMWHDRFSCVFEKDKWFISCLFKLISSDIIYLCMHMKCFMKLMIKYGRTFSCVIQSICASKFCEGIGNKFWGFCAQIVWVMVLWNLYYIIYIYYPFIYIVFIFMV